MIFDGEQLTDLMEPLDLGWRERRERELALMADLVPLLKKRAQGQGHLGPQRLRARGRAMTADKPSPLLPKLRFPEFINAWGTGAKPLEDLLMSADKNTKWSFIGGPFGSNLKSSDLASPEGIRVIQLQNIGDAEFVDRSTKYLHRRKKLMTSLSNNIYPGEIILSKMGDPVGRACLIPDTNRGM